MTPEAKVKKKVRLILETHGAYYAMPVTGGYGASGVPDFLVCHHGRFIGIECKAGTNRPTALQLSNMKRIDWARGRAIVVNEDNISDLETLLTEIEREEAKPKDHKNPHSAHAGQDGDGNR